MARIRVITDSACDLSAEVAAAHGIVIVPLSIRFGDEEFVDGKDLTTKEFWARCKASPVLPETAAFFARNGVDPDQLERDTRAADASATVIGHGIGTGFAAVCRGDV